MTGFQELDEDGLYRSLREYARVSAYLPVKIRPVCAEELTDLRSRIVVESALAEYPEMPEVEDEALSVCLRILNSKLDSIIRMLSFPSDGPREMDFVRVNISAGGLSTTACEYCGVDDIVEVKLMLPTAPTMLFYIYAKVLKCTLANDKYEIYVEFTEIEDDIRDQIERYVFQKQREILRKNRSRGA